MRQKVTLSLTHRCNMGCRYCYAGNKDVKSDMTQETLAQGLEFAWAVSEESRELELGFFGGEPLLRRDLMDEAFAWVRRRQEQDPRALAFILTTNGTLLDEEMLQWIRRHRIHLCISLDGPPEIQDVSRPLRGGGVSSRLVVANLKRAMEMGVGFEVNAVYGPHVLPALPRVTAYLHELGVGAFHLTPDIRADWEGTPPKAFAASFAGVAREYIRAFENGREVGVDVIDFKIKLFMKKGHGEEDRCGMGRNEWAVAPSGTVYPCERLIGEDDASHLQLGNVADGTGVLKRVPRADSPGAKIVVLGMPQSVPRRSLKKAKATVEKAGALAAPSCQECSLADFCMHWCGCSNYHQTGRSNLPSRMICASETAAILASQMVLRHFEKRPNAVFEKHFASLLQPVDCQSTPT
ncbi:MAG: radical SAM protein [Magnetococcales bacterium]|nr:radical SAM protein [Magnetococcales bacterium]